MPLHGGYSSEDHLEPGDGADADRGAMDEPTVLMSRAYPFGGVFVMRDRTEDPKRSTHAETPSLDIAVDGQPLFVDPGSVVTRRGNFHWESALEVTADVWCTTPEFDLLEARVAHNADGQTVVHRRRILRIGRGQWLIADDVGPEPVSFELQLQCDPSVSPTREQKATLRLSRPLGSDVLVHVAGPAVSEWHITEAWVGQALGKKKPAKGVGCSVGEKGGRSSMVICEETDRAVDLETLAAEGGECIAIHGPHPAYVMIKAPGVDYVRAAIGRTDADIAWIWPATTAGPARYLAIRGTKIELPSGVVTGLGGEQGWASGACDQARAGATGSLNCPEWTR